MTAGSSKAQHETAEAPRRVLQDPKIIPPLGT
jgi:hypothetical protein